MEVKSAIYDCLVSIMISVSVCMFVRSHISKTTQPNFTKFFMHVACDCGSDLLSWRCSTLCTSGFVYYIMAMNRRCKHAAGPGAKSDFYKCVYRSITLVRKVGELSSRHQRCPETLKASKRTPLLSQLGGQGQWLNYIIIHDGAINMASNSDPRKIFEASPRSHQKSYFGEQKFFALQFQCMVSLANCNKASIKKSGPLVPSQNRCFAGDIRSFRLAWPPWASL